MLACMVRSYVCGGVCMYLHIDMYVSMSMLYVACVLHVTYQCHVTGILCVYVHLLHVPGIGPTVGGQKMYGENVMMGHLLAFSSAEPP